ncbi:MAG: hypothetical protein DMG78_18030 [Acidobacteria bacterium]|nr:MAG: hypothetical protein DMG78_18030 [Acidobacteriota bacterium]
MPARSRPFHEPTIPDGYIVAVDSSQHYHTALDGKIVIAWHKNRGLTLSRFKSYDHTEVVEPENHACESIRITANDRWKIVAKVLWWIGKAP